MKTRYSSNGEVSIEGSQEEMELLSRKINDFVSSDEDSICIDLDDRYDPSSYERGLSSLVFLKAAEQNIQIVGDTLTFLGQSEFFESISNSLPYGVDETPYHIHYDSISFPQFLKAEAPEVVFEATH